LTQGIHNAQRTGAELILQGKHTVQSTINIQGTVSITGEDSALITGSSDVVFHVNQTAVLKFNNIRFGKGG